MADPKRLMERLGTGFERDLLALGANDAPDPEAKERVRSQVLEAMALGSVAAGATAAGAGGKASSSLGLVLVKWLSIGAVAGTVTAHAGSELATPARPPAEPPRSASERAPTEARAARTPAVAAPAVTPEITIEGSPAPLDSRSARGDVRIGATATLVEAESLRRIRAESKNDRARALRMLDEHLMRFPHGESAAEARRLSAELAAKK